MVGLDCVYPPLPSPTVTTQKTVRVCVRAWLRAHECVSPTCAPMSVSVCAADLCVLFQNESPNTSRQSPANGHSSINSSILVRTPPAPLKKETTKKQLQNYKNKTLQQLQKQTVCLSSPHPLRVTCPVNVFLKNFVKVVLLF